MAPWSRVKEEKLKIASQEGVTEERMGGDSSEDILRRGEACTLRLRAAVIESSMAKKRTR
jgi:hypothetical protein